MENGLPHIDELISKHFAAEASMDETAMLNSWRKASPQNEDYFAESKKLFDAIAAADTGIDVNVDAAWQKLNARISGEPGKVAPLVKRFTFARVAASLLLLAAMGFIAKWMFAPAKAAPAMFVAGNTTSKQKLPDGSEVFMNRNTEISYVAEEGKRHVKLKGEAFFDVKHNEQQPFEIEAGEVLIKDIGTSFNVKAIPAGNSVEVLVESGSVQFYTASNQGLTLVKGEKAVYNRLTREFSRIAITTNDNSISYMSKVFYFSNAALKDVVAAVNEVYGSDIRLATQGLGNCHVTVKFNNEDDVDALVSIIADTMDMEVEHKGKTIILKGAACPE